MGSLVFQQVFRYERAPRAATKTCSSALPARRVTSSTGGVTLARDLLGKGLPVPSAPVSLAVEVARPDPRPHGGRVVGVDLELKAFAVLSDGTVVAPGKVLVRAFGARRRRGNAHSRKKRGSRRRQKSARSLARLHTTSSRRR